MSEGALLMRGLKEMEDVKWKMGLRHAQPPLHMEDGNF